MSELPEPLPPVDSSDTSGVLPPAVPAIEATKPPTTPWGYTALGVFGVLYAIMLFVGGEFRSFALMGLFAIPFVLLTVLAYVSTPKSVWPYVTFLYWIGLMGAIGLITVLFAIGAIAMPTMAPGLDPAAAQAARDAFPSMEQGLRILGTVVSVLLAGVIGIVFFLPFVRRKAAAWFGTDPESFVHATALASLFAITLMGFVPLLAVNEPPLLSLLRIDGAISMPDADEQLRTTFYSLVWAVPACFVAVGYPLRRSWREARKRLGLEWPTLRQVVLAVIITGALLLIMPPIGTGIELLWKTMGWQTTDGELIEQLFGFTAGLAGAIIASVVAGFGEELVFRGVLQPRLGIFLPALMFTSVHALQYDFDALVQVLFLGVIFGLIRNRTNTTTSALIHAGYDFVLLMTAVHTD